MVCVVGKIPESARRIGVLAGAFNPPTRAHLALAAAAKSTLDCVVCVLPREYPHKGWSGASLRERISMLDSLGQTVLLADRGLFIDMAREFRRDIRHEAELHFICGRDAAERIVEWTYVPDLAPPIAEQLREYRLLVARREGEYRIPDHVAHGVAPLEWDGPDLDAISSTQMRDWLACGDPRWRDLAPPEITSEIAAIYRRHT